MKPVRMSRRTRLWCVVFPRTHTTANQDKLGNLSHEALRRPLALIERKVQSVTAYVDKWLQFQSLWDLEAEYVYQVGEFDGVYMCHGPDVAT